MKTRTPALLQANERTERLILSALLNGPLTFHRIAHLALPNVSFREVDARVRWLREHDQVETKVPAGEKKARWHITERGRARINQPPQTEFPDAVPDPTAQVSLP
jgi:DNA-binding HxlR family transcriptional regulator